MEFTYEINIDTYDIMFETMIEPARKPPLASLRGDGSSTTVEFNFDIDTDYLPLTLEFEPVGELSIAPLQISNFDRDDLSTPFELTLLFPRDQPLNFHVKIPTPDGEYEFLTRFEVYAPPYQVFEWGEQILPSRRPDIDTSSLIERRQSASTHAPSASPATYESMRDFFETDSVEEAIMEFADELGRWLSAPMYCFLLDQCAMDWDPLEEHFIKRGNRYWGRQLLLQSNSNVFELASWAEVQQLTSTTVALSHYPELDPQQIVIQAIECIDNPNCFRQVHDVEALWSLEQRYDIATNTSSVLDDRHFNALLAKAILERDRVRAETLVENWETPVREDDLQAAIEQAKSERGPDAIEKWRSLLLPALQAEGSQFPFVAANYFKAVGSTCDYPPYYSEIINKAQAALYARQGLEPHERTALYWGAFHEGHRYRKAEKYADAGEAFERAVRTAAAEYEDTGQNYFTDLGMALYLLFQTRVNEHRDNNNISSAIKEAERGTAFVSQLASLSEADRREHEAKLEALNHECQADMDIQTQQFQQAVAELGQAISTHYQVGNDAAATYLKNRQRGLQASLAEQQGEYTDAVDKHEQIATEVSDDNPFGQFHRARGKICRAKAHVVNRQLDAAHEQLETINYRGGTTGNEIEYLELLMSVLEDYENGRTSEIESTLNKLDSLSPLSAKDTHRIEYGHEYWPVFVTLLAAQRLHQFEIDESIPESMVKISLQDVLRPTHVEQVIKQEGLSDIGLEEQWKAEVPIFTLKQYQQAEKNEAGKIEQGNFKDIAESLTGTLEEFLEFIVAYEGRIHHGNNWHSQLGVSNNEPTLKPLVDALNKSMFDDRPWIEDVRDRLATLRYSNIVMPNKDGTLVDLRNDLDHNNISSLSKSEYAMLKEDIRTIFRRVSTEIPVLGQPIGENAYEAYTIRCFRSGFNQEAEIMIDRTLSMDEIYYFPQKTIGDESVVEIQSQSVVACTEQRVLEGLEKFAGVEVLRTKSSEGVDQHQNSSDV